MIHLTNADTGDPLGTLSEGELQFLIDTMEEETGDDQDYYIDLATLDFLISRGADPRLITLLTEAIGTGESVSIRWE
jgi:hypothetical protein